MKTQTEIFIAASFIWQQQKFENVLIIGEAFHECIANALRDRVKFSTSFRVLEA
jgi:hypothetical protein